MLIFLLAFISFHQWEWGLLGWDNSSVIHWQGYLTGSGLSPPGLAWDCEWDWLEEAAAKTLGCAPPARARLCWGLLVGVGGPAVEPAAFFHSAAPSAKKWVMSVGLVQHPTPHPPQTGPASLVSLHSVERHLVTTPCPSSPETWVATWAFHGTVEPLIRMGSWRAWGGELVLAWVWRGGALLPHQPTPSPRMVLLLPNWDHLSSCFTSRAWIFLFWS